MKKQLTKAFAELRKKGYFARQDFECCQSCGWASIPEEQKDKAVFYHHQDTQDIKRMSKVYLCWSGSGNEIVDTLQKYNLPTEWDGSDNKRILVTLN